MHLFHDFDQRLIEVLHHFCQIFLLNLQSITIDDVLSLLEAAFPQRSIEFGEGELATIMEM